MSNIHYIKNVTTFCGFVASPGQWTKQIPSMPSINPDVCVVRSITFLGPTNSQKVYMIWCSLINDYIGSCTAANITTQCPGSTFLLNSPVGNSLTFQLHVIDTVTNTVSLDQAVDGDVVIQMEFIKYINSPPHA
jgi:hypothetical protein